MKVFILTLLILNSLCFAFGDKDEKDDFIDIDSDEGEQLEDEQQPEDFVEDEEQNFMDELEDEDEDDAQEDEVNDEQQDSNDFKEDSIEDAAKTQETRPQPAQQNVDPGIEPTGGPLKPSDEGSARDPEEDADLKEALVDKLGLK